MPLKVSDFNPAGSLTGSELFGVVQSSENRKTTLDDVSDFVIAIANQAVFEILVSDPNGTEISTGDGKSYFTVPNSIDGWSLTNIEMSFTTASSSGAPQTQLANVTQTTDILSTEITVDANESYSGSAAIPAVINASNKVVAAGDILRIDNDAAGTGAKGQTVILTFQP